MKYRIGGGAACLVLALAAQAQAQSLRDINFGETLRGELGAGDPKHSDGTPYDGYRFQGRAGQQVVIDMQSAAFDAYLVLRRAGDAQDLKTDDDGGGGPQGHDSRLTFVLPANGDYEIRANAVSATASGPYALTLNAGAGAPPAPSVSVTPIALGQTLSGRLTTSDAKLGDNSYYDLYRFSGQAGQQVTATLRSGDFDAYVGIGPRGSSDSKTDDDSGGGNDAQVTYVLPTTGEYEIRANSLSANVTGAYTLQLTRSSPPAGPQARTISLGQTVEGDLTTSDVKATDNSYYDLYRFSGNAGQRVRITMASKAFDAYLSLRDDGDNQLASDDDGGGGTNAQIVYTLPRTGAYLIRANTLSANQTGAYALTLERAP